MMVQKEISLRARSRGCHLVTDEIVSQLPSLPNVGMLNLFVKHTSCALTVNENFDPDVRRDMNAIYNKLVPDGDSMYYHTDEGDDDMPSHFKSSMTGVSINIPITNGRLNLGTWQGIYLCEFRDYGGERRVVLTIME